MSELYEEVGMNLVMLARLYRRELDNALRMHGLSEANSLPIRYLARLGNGMRQGALAELMNLEGPSLIRVLDQLEKANLIARVDDANDRRAKLIRLTPNGEVINKKLNLELAAVRRRLFAGVQEADLEASLRMFEAVSRNIRPIEI